MKKSTMIALAFAVALGLASAPVNAQGHGGGRPAQKGLENAETHANANGQKGIENAENKQARDKDKDASGKKHAKSKSKKHKQHNKS